LAVELATPGAQVASKGARGEKSVQAFRISRARLGVVSMFVGVRLRNRPPAQSAAYRCAIRHRARSEIPEIVPQIRIHSAGQSLEYVNRRRSPACYSRNTKSAADQRPVSAMALGFDALAGTTWRSSAIHRQVAWQRRAWRGQPADHRMAGQNGCEKAGCPWRFR